MKNRMLWITSIIVVSIFVMIIASGITGADGNEGSGNEGSESGGSAGSEEAGTAFSLDEAYDAVRSGARLLLAFDARSNSFYGLVQNTTDLILQQVRVEVHLSNGVELGPTTPMDLAPGEVAGVVLLATAEQFNGWSPHAEVGINSGGGESVAGEHGAERGSTELNEAAMSSPIIPLGQSWDSVLGDLAISVQYDETTRSIYGTVENISTQTLCYVQAEPHIKSGRQTVAELGPEKLGDLNPGQRVNSSLSGDNEPNLAGTNFNGYVIHMEVFDCNGPGPIPHTGGESAGDGSEGGIEGSERGESDDEHGNRKGRGEHGNNESSGD